MQIVVYQIFYFWEEFMKVKSTDCKGHITVFLQHLFKNTIYKLILQKNLHFYYNPLQAKIFGRFLPSTLPLGHWFLENIFSQHQLQKLHKKLLHSMGNILSTEKYDRKLVVKKAAFCNKSLMMFILVLYSSNDCNHQFTYRPLTFLCTNR